MRFNQLLLGASIFFGAIASLGTQLEACKSGVESFCMGHDSVGNTTSVWQEMDDNLKIFVVKSAYLPSRGSWERSSVISKEGQYSYKPLIEVNDQGDCASLFLAICTETSQNVIMATSKPAGGSWTSPVRISDLEELIQASSFALLLGNDGSMVAMWSTLVDSVVSPGSFDEITRSATGVIGGDWNPPQTL